ncbi:MAG: hypothetical protein U0528_01535 [Anaerolineae bacterium]
MLRVLSARRVALALLLTVVSLLSWSFAAAQTTCGILYRDLSTGKLMLLRSQDGEKESIETSSVQISRAMLSPDHKLLAVALLDTGQEVEGQRAGTQLFDLTSTPPKLVDTIMLHFPVAWSHLSDRLLMRRTITAAGLYQIYDVSKQAVVPLRQIAAPISGSPFLNARNLIFLNVASALWSPDDSTIALLANEQPFPQDAEGANYGVYVITDQPMAQRLSSRSTVSDPLGWLRDGRLLFEECTDIGCTWNLIYADGANQVVVRPLFNDLRYVYNRLSPDGQNAIYLSSSVSEPELVNLNLLKPLSGESRRLDRFYDVVPPVISWSANSRNFTYAAPVTANIDSPFVPVIVDTDSGEAERIETLRVGLRSSGDWTPDSSIALLTAQQDGTSALFTYQPTTQQLIILTQPAPDIVDVQFDARWVCLP